MNKWEIITRKILVLATFGYDMQFFDKYVDDPNFLTEDWLQSHYGREWADPIVLDELNAIDLLASSLESTPFNEPSYEELP